MIPMPFWAATRPATPRPPGQKVAADAPRPEAPSRERASHPSHPSHLLRAGEAATHFPIGKNIFSNKSNHGKTWNKF